MTRITVIVEGATEEAFIKNVVAPSLWVREIFVTPVILGVPGHKGGNVSYARVRKDVLLQLKQDRTAYCSTMFDLYGLGDGFPGKPLPPGLNGLGRAMRIEQAFYEDIAAAIPELRPDVRFIPYLQVHEYEGLLFSDSDAFAAALGRQHISRLLKDIRDAFPTPEDINDDANTAPSKRVLALYPAYQKVIEGTVAAQAVGLRNMRRECPHFDEWVARLEALAGPLR
jgi:Domain of unknown function (DUF4276)